MPPPRTSRNARSPIRPRPSSAPRRSLREARGVAPEVARQLRARGSPEVRLSDDLDRRRLRRLRVPEHQPGLDAAVVAVDLEPDGRVDRLGRPGGQRAAAPERDAARARAAGGERERHVAALAHRTRVVQQGAGHEQRRLRVAHPERGEPLELLRQVEVQDVAGHDRVDALTRDEVFGRQHRRGVLDERRPERLDPPARDRQTGGRAVPAVAQQVGARRLEPAEQVERRDRAARARALLAVERDQHRRAVMALGDPRGDDPDHAGMPAVGGEHVGGRSRRRRGHLRLGLEQDPRLDVAPLDVDGVELGRDRSRPLGVGRQQQLEAGVGAVKPPGRVDPRREPEADRAGVERRSGRRARPPSAPAGPACGSTRARAGLPARAAGSRRPAARSRRRWRARPGRGRRRPARRPARRHRAAPARAGARRRPRTAPGTGSRPGAGARSARRAAARPRAARGGR